MPIHYTRTIVIALFAYVFTLFLVRLVGRKTVSQMTFFDFILGVTLGTVTATVAIGPNRTLAAITLVVFVAITVLLDYLHIESIPLRKLVNSEPVVIIENGGIIDQNLRRTKISIDELNMLLRQKNMFNISEVEFAVLETNGKLSVLPKSQKQPLTPSDLNIPTGYKGLTKDLIIDGEVMNEDLRSAKLNEQWLQQELKKNGIKNVGEVFYAGLDTSGNYMYLQNNLTEMRNPGNME